MNAALALLEAYAPALASGSGLVVGLMLWALLPRNVGPAAHLAMRRRELRASLALTVDNLRELDERQGRLHPEEGARERQALEARAQAALAGLRELERSNAEGPAARAVASARPKDAAMGLLASRPQLRGLLWGLTGGSLGVFLFMSVRQGAKVEPMQAAAVERPGAAAGPPSGGGGGVPAPSFDPRELEALRTTLERNPDDVPALVRFGHIALQAQQLEEGAALTERALKLAPNNLEALVHRAVAQAGRGEGEAAAAGLAAVLQRDPGFAEAWFFRGMLAMQAGQMDRMRESFAQFVQVAPDGPQKERIRAMVERSRTD